MELRWRLWDGPNRPEDLCRVLADAFILTNTLPYLYEARFLDASAQWAGCGCLNALGQCTAGGGGALVLSEGMSYVHRSRVVIVRDMRAVPL